MALDQYYNRHDPAKGFEKHLFRAGKGLQSAELNEVQEYAIERIKSIGDSLYKDGDIVRDCSCLVDPDTGSVTLDGGAIYLMGKVRGIVPSAFTIPVDRTVSIGVRVTETTVTEFEDPTLKDPATGTRNYNEPGAGRLKVSIAWGWDGDGESGEFFGVYTSDSGILLQKDLPPQMDSVTNALARYDRDSTGGNYITEGLSVAAEFDKAGATLTYTVSEGRARANGYGIEIPRSVRVVEASDPDLKEIISEPHTYSETNGSMRLLLDNFPVTSVDQVRITAQKTATLTHGAFSGAKDPLPDTSVLQLIAVSQGATNYVIGTDCKLTSGQVDWSLTGAEPAPGSSYSVTYQYLKTTEVTDIDDYGFTVSGAVEGSLVVTDYHFAMPRIDAIVVDAEGRIDRIKGVSVTYNPPQPSVPSTMLKIASLQHDWMTDPKVVADGVKVIPMSELQGIRGLVFDLYDLVAQERLKTQIGLAEPASKRGVFVDPLNNDNLRDAGINQNAAIIDGVLTLPIIGDVKPPAVAISIPQQLAYAIEPVIEQLFRTGSQKVNPYLAFAPIPANVTISPAVDFWTESQTTWLSSETRRFVNGWGNVGTTSSNTGTELVATRSVEAEFLRQVFVEFTLNGFGSGEQLQTVTFDGITVTPEAI